MQYPYFSRTCALKNIPLNAEHLDKPKARTNATRVNGVHYAPPRGLRPKCLHFVSGASATLGVPENRKVFGVKRGMTDYLFFLLLSLADCRGIIGIIIIVFAVLHIQNLLGFGLFAERELRFLVVEKSVNV